MAALDELTAASAASTIFAVDHPHGGRRVAAHIFAWDCSIAWAELGWPPSSFLVHLDEGLVRRVGDHWYCEQADGVIEYFPLPEAWRLALRDPDWPQGDRARCLELIQGFIDPSARDVSSQY